MCSMTSCDLRAGRGTGLATILVSGASRGLGAALCEQFRRGGATVYAGTRSPSAPGDVALNVRSEASCAEAVRHIANADGGIDILVNNAGMHLAGPVGALDQDQFKEVLDVNLLGAWRLTKAAVPHMRQGGTIAMISSLSGLVGLPDDGAYAASKFALEGMSQSLASELAPRGIGVLVFVPGRIATGFAGTSSGTAPAAAAQWIVDAIARDDTPFRSPVGDDAADLFERINIDRGDRAESVVRHATGRDWDWRRHT